MKKKNYKGKMEKLKLSKCQDVCRFHNDVQKAYAKKMNDNDEVKEFYCNYPLDGYLTGYTSDLVFVLTDNTMKVRECVLRKHIEKPMILQDLDNSYEWWKNKGIDDWGVVIDEEE